MSNIKVTSADLHSVSGQLASGSADIESRLSSLHAQVQGLVDNGWQGSASSAFHELYQQWHTSAGQLKQALDGISGSSVGGHDLRADRAAADQPDVQLTQRQPAARLPAEPAWRGKVPAIESLEHPRRPGAGPCLGKQPSDETAKRGYRPCRSTSTPIWTRFSSWPTG